MEQQLKRRRVVESSDEDSDPDEDETVPQNPGAAAMDSDVEPLEDPPSKEDGTLRVCQRWR